LQQEQQSTELDMFACTTCDPIAKACTCDVGDERLQDINSATILLCVSIMGTPGFVRHGVV